MSLATRLEPVQGRLAGVREEVAELAQETKGIGDDLREIVRAEARLALAETKEQGVVIAKVSAAGVAALTFAYITLFFLFLTVMFALDTAMPLWAAALITTAICALILAVAALLARSFAKQISPMPKRTIATIREDVRWAKSQLKSNER